jgi:hypothetical protein
VSEENLASILGAIFSEAAEDHDLFLAKATVGLLERGEQPEFATRLISQLKDHLARRRRNGLVRSPNGRALAARLARRKAGSRDCPAQQLIELLILRRGQKLLPLRAVGKITGDQSPVRVAQSVGDGDPRVSLPTLF